MPKVEESEARLKSISAQWFTFRFTLFTKCHGSDGKESACNTGNPGSVPGSGRSPGGGNGNPLWYSCLKNPRDRVAWQATVHEVTKSQT